MFLRNYDNYWTVLNSRQFFASQDYSGSTSTTQFGDGYFNLKTPAGTISNILYNNGVYYQFSSGDWLSFYSPICLTATCICLGTGSTPVTYDDYKLSGNVVTLGLSQQSSSTKFLPETNRWRRTIVCTCSNLTEDDVTINEWGLYKSNTATSSVPVYTNSLSTVALMFREVLDTPITIKAGTTSTITFSIDIPMPNHP